MRWSRRRREAAELLPELRAVREQLAVTLTALQQFDAVLTAAARQRPDPGSPRGGDLR